MREEILYGINPVNEALSSGKVEIEKIYISQDAFMGRIGSLLKKARERGIPVSNVPPEILRKIAGTGKNQGIVASVSAGRYLAREEILGSTAKDAIILILDGVEDPGNFGAIIRSAVAAGISGIFVPAKGSAGMTSITAKRSAGSILHAKIAREKSLITLADVLKKRGFHLVAVEKKGEARLFDAAFKFPLALIFGSESKGIRKELIEKVDTVISIPMDDKVESLNISVACGIVLYELVRRRLHSSI